MSKLPYMPFYAAEYIADTQHLSAEQHGIYMLLLCSLWRHKGGLENHAGQLARIAKTSPKRWNKVAGPVLALCYVDEATGLLRHKRVDEELQKAERISQNRSHPRGNFKSRKPLKNNEPPPSFDLHARGESIPESESTPPIPPKGDERIGFEKFRERWPAKHDDLERAEAFWDDLDEADRFAAVEGVPRYAAEVEKLQRRPCSAWKYLAQRRWNISPAEAVRLASRLVITPDCPSWRPWEAEFAARGNRWMTNVMRRALEGQAEHAVWVDSEWPPNHKPTDQEKYLMALWRSKQAPRKIA